MIDFLWECGSLLLRWLHIVAAMAWIGSSFFFMHLDASLRKTAEIPASEGAAAWQVHGGGFYEMRKYFVAPGHLDPHLTWHKWQSYSTWLSGFVLIAWIYYAQASLYLIDPAVRDISPAVASGIGVGALAAGWLVYDLTCRSPLGRNEGTLAIVGLAFVTLAAYGFANVFSARGALIHTGALMATWMAGNVFLVIIPNQRKVVAALLDHRPPDPALGKQAKQRSAQNNYLTLPVILLMISNHYPFLFAGKETLPLIVALATVAGALVRYFYNVRHADHERSPWWAWGAAAAVLAGAFALALSTSPLGRRILDTASAGTHPRLELASASPPEEVVGIVLSRCSMCHASEPLWDGIAIAPKGVHLDDAAAIARQVAAIRYQAVDTHNMPPNNLTGITDEERDVLAAWARTDRR
ncbi:urate hydroxylase PuuD [Methylobacterium oryzae]|uniref:Cysteine desulfurase n=1 Tax=Methylobacterium oryzae TaxID=334852 RepID=A0ABU7TTV3_9HYPH